MKKLLALALFLIGITAFAQTDNVSPHRWKPLSISEKEKIWYDAAMVDSVKRDKFDMYILQMHKPPLAFENIKGEVYRSKTLYTVSLKTVKYGIKKAVYYDVTNKEIASFDYNIDSYPENIKYTYPIMENSFLYTLIKELFHK